MSLYAALDLPQYLESCFNEQYVESFVVEQMPNATSAQKVKQSQILTRFLDRVKSTLVDPRLTILGTTSGASGTNESQTQTLKDVVADVAHNVSKLEEQWTLVENKKRKFREEREQQRVKRVAAKRAQEEKKRAVEQRIAAGESRFTEDETRAYAAKLVAAGKTYYTPEQRAAYKTAQAELRNTKERKAKGKFVVYTDEQKEAYQREIADKAGRYYTLEERKAYKAQQSRTKSEQLKKSKDVKVLLPATEKAKARQYFWTEGKLKGKERSLKAKQLLHEFNVHWSQLNREQKKGFEGNEDPKSLRAIFKSVKGKE